MTVGAPKGSPTMAASFGYILTSWISTMTLSRATHLPAILRVAATFSSVLLPSCRRRGRTHCSFGLAIGTGTWVVFLRHLPQFSDALVFLLRRPPPVVSSCSGLMRALRLFRWPTATLALGRGTWRLVRDIPGRAPDWHWYELDLFLCSPVVSARCHRWRTVACFSDHFAKSCRLSLGRGQQTGLGLRRLRA